LMAIVISVLSKLFRRHSARIQSSVGDVARITEEALQSHRIVKMFAGQKYESERFGSVNNKNMHLNMRLISTRAGGDALTNIVIALGLSGVIYFVMFENIRPPAADLAGFITAMVFLLRPIRQLTNINVSIQRGIAAGISIFELLDEPEEPDEGTFAVDRVSGHVEFRSVNFTYSAQKGAVLSDISVDVASGEMLAIVGRSGSGKSTLLRLIAGLETLQQGRIEISGVRVAGPNYHISPERRAIGFVFQDYALFPHLDVLRNVIFGMGSRSKTNARQRAETLLDRVGMATFRDAMPHTLSGGQQQRVALARALAREPSVMLLDEPFSGLDARLRGQVRRTTLEVLREAAVATVMVTHDPQEALVAADVISVISEGKVLQAGTPRDVYRASVSRLVAEVFGPVNVSRGQVDGGFVSAPWGEIPAPGFEEGFEVELLLRPENLQVAPHEGGEGVPAKILEIQKGGAFHLAILELEDSTRWKARDLARHGWRVGDAVRLISDPESTMIRSLSDSRLEA